MMPIIYVVKHNVLEIAMRVSREQFAQNREKILTAAGKLFLDKGFTAIGVAEVMKAAGFTHGGFYGHFESKEQLAYEASRELFRKTEESWKWIVSSNPDAPLDALLKHYLASANLFGPGRSCVFATLSQELGRQSEEMRAAFADALNALAAILVAIVPGSDEADRKHRALFTLTAMMGAVSLARATGDPVLAEALLAAARQDLLQRGHSRLG
ncbi:TetR/AcrR family transcriptional regulator [Rhizobium sp. SG570]|uniref:TetR/AcrR family transcriptional regulator n=1 Tax=Rhizobium sp. SG570 TaxID=2587113 RepID=UPI00184B5CC9|nr:TetR/AcrR family transcriptional repressor of nem operon [Rhizobium sp. SG570]